MSSTMAGIAPATEDIERLTRQFLRMALRSFGDPAASAGPSPPCAKANIAVAITVAVAAPPLMPQLPTVRRTTPPPPSSSSSHRHPFSMWTNMRQIRISMRHP